MVFTNHFHPPNPFLPPSKPISIFTACAGDPPHRRRSAAACAGDRRTAAPCTSRAPRPSPCVAPLSPDPPPLPPDPPPPLAGSAPLNRRTLLPCAGRSLAALSVPAAPPLPVLRRRCWSRAAAAGPAPPLVRVSQPFRGPCAALPRSLRRHPLRRIPSSQLEGYPQSPPSASSPPQSSPPLFGPASAAAAARLDSSAAGRTSFICGLHFLEKLFWLF
ncbi:hypothetical protein Syun_008147 [Stephania yunnanensis]|uniref:Uncharacterized protein n=1 Tax=Stephania yunnanensis TaxID=152371 RepID=A0AAP0L020_9MAGN